MSDLHTDASPPSLAELVARATGASPLDCYQCGRCAAGCFQNVPGEMDVSPTRIMHLLQLEAIFRQEPAQARDYACQALGSDTPWLCAGCQACTTRCPQGVDIAGAMDVLRQEALRRGVASRSRRARDIQALHRVFLRQALKRGRQHELALVKRYKLATGHLFQDAALGPAMLRKGKLHVFPQPAPDSGRVQQAAEALRAKEGTGH
jgi:heterodisulfide reductase subunit C